MRLSMQPKFYTLTGSRDLKSENRQEVWHMCPAGEEGVCVCVYVCVFREATVRSVNHLVCSFIFIKVHMHRQHTQRDVITQWSLLL